MRALVTGAAGFIGGHLVERLLAAGREVRALVRLGEDASGLHRLGVEVIEGDVRDRWDVARAVAGCAHAYHVAGATSWGRFRRREMWEINVGGTANVAEAAAAAGIERLVYASSVGVYGSNCRSPLDEYSATRPNSLYRRTKLAGERAAKTVHVRTGLPLVIARVSTVLGPGSDSWRGLFVAVVTKRIRIVDSGRNRTHVADVADIADGLQRCAETALLGCSTYVLAGPEPVRIHELVATIGEELGVPPMVENAPALSRRLYHRLANAASRGLGAELPRARSVELFVEDRWFSIAAARRELNYHPIITTRRTIQRTIEDYRRRGILT